MSRQLFQFPGGLHLAAHKEQSLVRPLASAVLPRELVLPLHQHIGAEARPLVAVGDEVLKGQMVARADGFISVPLHAPTSGRVVAIEDRAVPHPSGLSARCIVIEPDGRDRWCELHPLSEWPDADPSALRNRIREAGVVGLGGAGFPTAAKLASAAQAVDTLILNGAECEPYITCDDWLMRHRADEVIRGAQVLLRAVGARVCLLGVEDNKPEAIAALTAEVERLGEQARIEVIAVPTRYPAGGDRQLTQVLTGREVPSGKRSSSIGVVCQNVATAASAWRAVARGEPLITRIVTVTGSGVREPRNFEAPIGMAMLDLLVQAGGTTADFQRLVMGGPMMGFTMEEHRAPIIKTTNCLLALRRNEIEREAPVRPCIRCGACAEVCPMSLLPQQLYWYAKNREFDRTRQYHLFDCIECGCCGYVCPSKLPLVQYFRFAKTEIAAKERDQKAADLARRRFEYRKEREERERSEKEERMRKRTAAVSEGSADDAKKAAIQAALERAKAKKAAAVPAPDAKQEP